jgi:hypothetical protein
MKQNAPNYGLTLFPKVFGVGARPVHLRLASNRAAGVKDWLTKKNRAGGSRGPGAIPPHSFRFEIEVKEIGLNQALEPDG